MSFIILFIIFLLWSVVLLRNALFWIYLWQVKEYRADRMRVHFQEPSSKKLILNKRLTWLLGMLILASLPFSVAQSAALAVILFFYSFFGVRTLQALQKKKIKIPKFTFRAILVFAGVILLYAGGTAAVFIYAQEFLLVWFIAADILLFAGVSLAVLATHPLAALLKNRTLKRAAEKRGKMKNLLVIGITGSYGKSTMKDLLYSLLSGQFKTIKTPENVNAEIGIAKVILKNLKQEHEVFIAEMGAYKKGEIKKSAETAQPQIGVLTGIGNQHISLFGNFKNIQEGKYELIEALPEKGLAVFNGNNKYTLSLFRQCNTPKRVYTTDPTIDISKQKVLAEKVTSTAQGLEIKVKEKGDSREYTLKSSLLGEHNAINIMGAVTVARELDVPFDEIQKKLAEFKPRRHALRTRKGIKESTVLDDSYTANMHGVLSALSVLRTMNGNNKICILRPLIELGDAAERVHKRIASEVASICDYFILTSTDYFKVMYKEAIDVGMDKGSIFAIPDAHKALRKAQELTDKGDIILIENRVPQNIVNGLTLD